MEVKKSPKADLEERTDDVKKALNEAGDEIEKAKDKNPFNLETL